MLPMNREKHSMYHIENAWQNIIVSYSKGPFIVYASDPNFKLENNWRVD